MLDRVLQLMHGLHHEHRQAARASTAIQLPGARESDGDGGVAGKMPARFADHVGLAVLGDIGLGDDAEREAEDAPDARVPIGRPEHPEQIGGQRIAIAREFSVLLPVLRIAMVGEVLDLIEVARIEQDEAEQAAENLVEPLGAEHRRMAELVLARHRGN